MTSYMHFMAGNEVVGALDRKVILVDHMRGQVVRKRRRWEQLSPALPRHGLTT